MLTTREAVDAAARFSHTPREGYSRPEVDAFVASVRSTVEALQDERPVPVNVQAARLLEMAQRCADAVVAEARETADHLLAEAGAHATAVEDAAREREQVLERAGHEQEERLRDRIERLEAAEAEVRERVAALTARLAGVLDGPPPTPGPAPTPHPQDAAGASGETPDEEEAPVSVYEQLGREHGIGAAVELFYERVVADPQLAPYFTGTDMTTLRRHQTALLVQVTGGPVQYEGRDLARAHAGLGISSDDFDRVVTHLATTLTDLGVAGSVVEQVGAALGAHREEIVQHPADVG